MPKFAIVLIALICCVTPSVFAQENHRADFLNSKDHWTILGGYGISHKGFGSTETRVETVEVILGYGYFMTEELGESWFRGRHDILIEIPFRAVTHPKTAIMAGINLIAKWNFTAPDIILPYIFVGGGPIYTNLDIPGLGTELNFSYQGGLGMNYFIKKDTALNFNYRFHHMSNAGTAHPNEAINSSRILIGLSFFR